ncbi:LOW QUALITY PROTEIN: borealin-2-like [Ara ararauna]
MLLRKPEGKRRSTDLGMEPDCGAVSQKGFLSTCTQRFPLYPKHVTHMAVRASFVLKPRKIPGKFRKLDSLLQRAEKVFTVELLKVPAAIRKIKRHKSACPSFSWETVNILPSSLYCAPFWLYPENSVEDLGVVWLPRSSAHRAKAFSVSHPPARRVEGPRRRRGLREGGEEVVLPAAVTDCSLEGSNPKLVRTSSRKRALLLTVDLHMHFQISKTKSVSLLSGLNGKLNPLSSTTNFKATPKVSKM